MIQTGKWAVGHDRSTGSTILRFEFLDREPLELSIPKDQAQQIARAIAAQDADARASRN